MNLNECSCGCGGSKSDCLAGKAEGNRYMFFSDLKTIKTAVDALLQMDPEEVTELLNNGHDWAADHVATSKDDIEEVSGFLMNELGGSREEMPAAKSPFAEEDNIHAGGFVHTFESYTRIVEDLTKKYGETITVDNFKKLKKGQRVVYKGNPYTIEKPGEYTITLASENGKTRHINYNMFNKDSAM